MGIKKGFTLVELLIVVAILAILSGAAYLGIQRSQARVMNEKVVDDLAAITNALEQFKQDEGHYPNIADGELKLDTEYNINCFASDTTYSHDCEDPLKTAFIQTQVDNNLLTKRYLQEVPTDPHTKSRYVYGVTTDGQFFQVAGNYQLDDGVWIAKVRGNVEKGFRLPSLLRAFNGPNFVMDGEGYLPYSLDHLNITATLDEISGQVTVDGNIITSNSPDEDKVVQPGSIIEVAAGDTVAIYFSDGSLTYLDGDVNGARLQIHPKTEVEKNDKDGIITKIRLKLFSGKIWSKVARLASESEFNVETTNSIAGVRGTEFGINGSGTELIVLSGKVAARQKKESEPELSDATTVSSWIFSGKTDIADSFIVVGTGTFDTAKFYIPDANAGTIQHTGSSTPDEAYIKATFYKGSFNNNYRPRILEVDTASPSKKIVFEYLAGVNLIKAMDMNGNEYLFMNIEIEPDKTLTIEPSTSLMVVGPVKFQFVSEYGNATGFSNPAVSLMVGTRLAEADIYNMGVQGGQGGQGGGGQGQAPLITNSPISLMLTESYTFEATEPCTWSVEAGMGGTFVNNIYHTIDSSLTANQLMLDIGARFDNVNTKNVKVRCTNAYGSDEVLFPVTYKAWAESLNGSGYRYSYLAGKKIWDEAKNACLNLHEGGHTWSLPSKGDSFVGMDRADGTMNDKTSLTEIGLTCEIEGNICKDTQVFGTNTGAIWLLDLNGNEAYSTNIQLQQFFSTNKSTPYAFRCVVQ